MASIVSQGIMTKSQTGLIAALFYLIYAPFQVIGGLAADRFSPCKLILFGTFGAGICNSLVYFFSGNYIAMIIIWSLNAIIQFGIWPSIFKITVAELSPDLRSRGVFFIMFTPSAGLALSYVTAAFITDWRMNFLLSAIILFTSVVVFFFVYTRLEKSMVDAHAPEKLPQSDKKVSTGIALTVIKSGVPLLLLVYIVQGLLNVGVKALVPVMLTESYESITAQTANLLNVILVVASPVGMFISRLSFFKKFSYPAAISILFGICLPLLAILLFVGVISVALVIAALVFVTLSMSTTTIFFSLVSKTFEKYGYGGALSGLFNCMSSLGLVLANYVFTLVADEFGWQATTSSWLVIAAVSFVLALITIPMWKKFTREFNSEEAAKN